MQIENVGKTKGFISNLHTATSPHNSSLFEKELCEKGELKRAVARWEVYCKSSQGACGRLASACFCFATQDGNTFNCAKAKLSGTQI